MQPFHTEILVRWFKAADPQEGIDNECLIQLIDDTNQLSSNLESLKKQHLETQINQISNEIWEELNKHKNEVKPFAKFLAHHSNGSGDELNGACKSVLHLFTIIKEITDATQIFDIDTDNTFAHYSNNLSIVKFESDTYVYIKKYKKPPSCQTEDIQKLIEAELDERDLKALKSADPAYRKKDLIKKGTISINDFGKQSLEELIEYFEEKNYLKIKELRLCDYIVDKETKIFELRDEDIDLILEKFPNLTSLSLANCKMSNETAQNLAKLTTLIDLDLTGCKTLSDFRFLESLTSLKKLNLNWCIKFQSTDLPLLPPSLTSLNISNIPIDSFAPSSTILPELQHLEVNHCLALTKIDLKDKKHLISLRADSCTNLAEEPNLENCSLLEILILAFCKKLTSIPSLVNFKKLKHVNLKSCLKLKNIEAFKDNPSIETVNLASCKTEMNVLLTCPSLKEVTILSNNDMPLRLQKRLSGKKVKIKKLRFS